MKKIAILLVLIFFLSSCSTGTNPGQRMSDRGGIDSDGSGLGGGQDDGWRQQIAEREKICFDFFKNEMITPQEGVRTNYLDTAHNTDFATGAEVLSESMGMQMLYAVAIQDEALFKSSLGFVEEYLDTGSIIAYRYSEENGAYRVNAFVDDIRIIRALISAGGVFDGNYTELAEKYSDRLYETNVKNGYIRDMYDEENGANNDFITLCYADLYTIRLLEGVDAKWEKVFAAMRKLVEEGYISDAFPVFASSYSYASGKYSEGDIHMTEAVLTALNLARIGDCPQRTVDYLKDSIKNGSVYGTYGRDGTKKSDTESTAIYAICALIAKEVHDEEMYRMCIDKMNRFQVTDKKSEIYGAFADPVSLDLYSFDNLAALLAYSGR